MQVAYTSKLPYQVGGLCLRIPYLPTYSNREIHWWGGSQWMVSHESVPPMYQLHDIIISCI